MKYCPNCSAPNADNAEFCAKCGTLLGQSTPAETMPKMGFSDAVRICFKEKFKCFEGRAKRTEYWYFYLFTFLVTTAAAVAGSIFALIMGLESNSVVYCSTAFTSIAFLVMLIPTLAVSVRRLHDTGRSGIWFFICFAPYVGSIVLLIFFLLPSRPEDNEYGPYQVFAE